MPARSALVMLEATARSGLPTYPRKTVSPEKRQTSFPVESTSWKQELSRVWPGVWITLILMFPRLRTYPSVHS